MPIEIKWSDVDPQTGERRYLSADKFAGQWHFKSRLHRRGDWNSGVVPTVEMWEHVLDSLERRYRRRQGVSDLDVDQVSGIVRELRRKQEEEE